MRFFLIGFLLAAATVHAAAGELLEGQFDGQRFKGDLSLLYFQGDEFVFEANNGDSFTCAVTEWSKPKTAELRCTDGRSRVAIVESPRSVIFGGIRMRYLDSFND